MMKSKTPKTDEAIYQCDSVARAEPLITVSRSLEGQVNELRETLERMAKSPHWTREDFMFEARAALERTKPE